MIRVLHALNELHPSGAERMLASAAPLWAEHGIEAVVLGAGAHHPFADELRTLGYRVVLTPSTRSVRGLAAFAEVLREIRPDVVHLHAESMFAPMAVVARSSRSVRVVFRTIHSVVASTGPDAHARARRRRLALAQRAGMQAFACSGEVAAHEKAAFGLDTRVIENWVDTTVFGQRMSQQEIARTKAGLGLDENDVVVTMVGNCAHAKNHELLFNATAGASGRLKIVHVGHTASMSEEERRIYTRLERRGSVVMLGARDDVSRVMAASDAVAVPSRREGFSVVAAEALCSAVPLLVARSPGLAWLKDFATPRLLSNDVSVWSSALNDLAAGDRPLQSNLEQDRADALLRFSPGRGVNDWAEAYRLSPLMASV